MGSISYESKHQIFLYCKENEYPSNDICIKESWEIKVIWFVVCTIQIYGYD